MPAGVIGFQWNELEQSLIRTGFGQGVSVAAFSGVTKGCKIPKTVCLPFLFCLFRPCFAIHHLTMDLESLAEFIRMHKESLERDKRELEVINR